MKKKHVPKKEIQLSKTGTLNVADGSDMEAVRESELQYRRLFESAKDGILILDAETGVVNDVNPFLIDILGYTREQFVGARIWELGFIRNIVANKEHFEKLKTDKYIRYEDMPLETDDGRRIDVEFVSNVYLVNNKAVIQCNIRDITDRKKIEGELKLHRERLEELVAERAGELERTHGQLIQSQKMEVVGQLAGGIAHDFNNILAVILGTSELVISNMKLEDPNYERVERIIKSGMRAKNITGRLLMFARKEKIEMRSALASDILLDMVNILLSSITNKIEICTSVSDHNLVISGDVNQLGQAILNICINACDAMADGGKLNIVTTAVSLDDDFCAAHIGLSPGDYCLVEIRDEGHGMAPEVLPRIFEPFYTTKEKGKGTGLGLSVTDGIIKMHNGHIMAESEPGRGTNMKVYLPATKARIDEDKNERNETQRHGSRETILIVDDEKDFTHMMSDFLRIEGYNPVAANSGKEAIHIFKSRDDIKLVILDIVMPVMDGGEVFAALRRIREDAKIILCSGFSSEGKASEIINKGACGYIHKPFDSAKMLKIISETLMKDETL